MTGGGRPESSRIVDVIRDAVVRAVLLLARAPHLRDAICFHAQQAAEKGLKALVVAAGREPPHVHDLVLLLAELGDAVPDMGIAPRDWGTSSSRRKERHP